MMMILPAVGAFTAAAAAALSLCSGRNMVQTFLLVQKHAVNNTDTDTPPIVHQLEQLIVMPSGNNDGAASASASKRFESSEILVNYIKSLKRKESLQLFLSCQPPTDLSSIQGEWNGVLLENGTLLTSITRFLTNSLFGKGRIWNGKAFVTDSQGINRFNTATATAADVMNNEVEKRHRFDYSIAPSRLVSAGRRRVGGTTMKNSSPLSSSSLSSLSLTLVYKEYQPPLSLWRTMVDEVRLIPLPSTADCEMLIGMGSMAWSGGMLNTSPFLLWRYKAKR